MQRGEETNLVHTPKKGLVIAGKGGLALRGLELIKTKKTIVRCWGYNRFGQCDVPADLGAVKQIAGGGYHSMALLEGGTVRCWGNNEYGQCDVPADLGKVKQIAGGVRHSMALLADGTVRCWGFNDDGQCDVPSDLGEVKQIAVGFKHSVALIEVSE